jgi:uncharacterized protein DUF3806
MLAWLRVSALFITLLLPAAQAAALDDVLISQPSYLDKQYMHQQRELLAELLSRNYGARFSGQKERDISLLQRLLDDKLVRNDQTQELQAMGVIMGDLLSTELDLHWVIYQDRLGRSRALRYKDTEAYLFPITMISRRREVDNQARVADIYRKAVDTITPAIPKLPFQ